MVLGLLKFDIDVVDENWVYDSEDDFNDGGFFNDDEPAGGNGFGLKYLYDDSDGGKDEDDGFDNNDEDNGDGGDDRGIRGNDDKDDDDDDNDEADNDDDDDNGNDDDDDILDADVGLNDGFNGSETEVGDNDCDIVFGL